MIQLLKSSESTSGLTGLPSKAMYAPSVVISHPTGNQNVRNALRSLIENGMLKEFWTTIAWDQESFWNRMLPQRLRTLLARRSFAEAPRDLVQCVPWREMVRLSDGFFLFRDLLCSGERPFSVIGMYRHFDGKVAARLGALRPDAVFAYEGGALKTFREARRLGIATVYELPSTFWYWEHKLLSEEAKRNPEFAELLPKLKDSPAHMRWKDEELQLADAVIVPSELVRETLKGVVPDERIRVVGYGAPPVRPRRPIERDPDRPLKVLFVGALSQRKGIGYLLDAIEILRARIDLTLIGGKIARNARVDAACRRWRWHDTLSHAEVLAEMQQAEVLVLPSLAEGCALVVLEALACGLPVIITPNTGAAGFVKDGCEGFVVPICSAEAIAGSIETLSRNRNLLAAMSRNAQTAAAARSWESYRADFAHAVRSVVCH